MKESPELPRVQLIIIALVQSLMLFALYKSVDLESWPSQSPLWFYPLWTLALSAPVLILLSLDKDNARPLLKLCSIFCGVLCLLALYTGFQAQPFGEFPIANLSLVFTASMVIACFKGLMYIQQRAGNHKLSYPVLFTLSWRNFLAMALSILFVGVFGLILTLWAALFAIIDIDFFKTLFKKDWFLFPVLGLAFGIGIIIFRELTQVIDNITKLLRGLIKLLLPLVVMVSVLFVLALPFAGFDKLWETRNGTALLLWLTAIILFFSNAVYQDGREINPYPSAVHTLVQWGQLALPILSGLSAYGLWLRLAQYGWTVERGWAVLIWFVLTLFSVGYTMGILAYRSQWPLFLAKVNSRMGLVVLALMLLVNTPLLDFRALSANSQLARLESQEIKPEEVDFYYAHQNLARPGYLLLKNIRDNFAEKNPILVDLIDKPRPTWRGSRIGNTTQFWDNLVYRPKPFDVPPELSRILNQQFARRPMQNNVLIEIDLDDDQINEYVLINLMGSRYSNSIIFYQSTEGWQSNAVYRNYRSTPENDVWQTLQSGEIKLQPHRFKNIVIGDLLFESNQGQ